MIADAATYAATIVATDDAPWVASCYVTYDAIKAAIDVAIDDDATRAAIIAAIYAATYAATDNAINNVRLS